MSLCVCMCVCVCGGEGVNRFYCTTHVTDLELLTRGLRTEVLFITSVVGDIRFPHFIWRACGVTCKPDQHGVNYVSTKVIQNQLVKSAKSGWSCSGYIFCRKFKLESVLYFLGLSKIQVCVQVHIIQGESRAWSSLKFRFVFRYTSYKGESRAWSSLKFRFVFRYTSYRGEVKHGAL